MDTLIPLIVAGAAAAAILFIAIGLAGSSSVDPVQARLTQLGSMQAKNLEELELQQPFLERTIRPLAGRLSGDGLPLHLLVVHVADREEPGDGRQPGRPAGCRLAGHQGDLARSSSPSSSS